MADLIIRNGNVVDGTGADAFVADVVTVKRGEVTFADGADTGARPGRLLRGAR